MQYYGNIFRPPSEAYSLIIQVTLGCAHNTCTFCSMYKDKSFSVRQEAAVFSDLAECRAHYNHVERIFLADGDALVLKTDALLRILERIQTLFPECRKVSAYGSPTDVLAKSDSELRQLKDAGLSMLYIGAESGSDTVLAQIQKGVTSAQIIEAVRKVEGALITSSVTFISGLAGAQVRADGTPLWREHAQKTGELITQAAPSYVGLLTLMTEREAPLYERIKNGTFKLLSAMQIMEETLLLLEHVTFDLKADVKNPLDNCLGKCVFRSNHASNYLSLAGDLPHDTPGMIAELKSILAQNDEASLKDEYFRAL
ncbi:MAG: radical SAM protein [Treponemataceae bacterium]|nr:MAG: radical SAM protein [Treponemataceae bacterium]